MFARVPVVACSAFTNFKREWFVCPSKLTCIKLDESSDRDVTRSEGPVACIGTDSIKVGQDRLGGVSEKVARQLYCKKQQGVKPKIPMTTPQPVEPLPDAVEYLLSTPLVRWQTKKRLETVDDIARRAQARGLVLQESSAINDETFSVLWKDKQVFRGRLSAASWFIQTYAPA